MHTAANSQAIHANFELVTDANSVIHLANSFISTYVRQRKTYVQKILTTPDLTPLEQKRQDPKAKSG